MRGRVCHLERADVAEFAIDGDVIPVAEHPDGQIRHAMFGVLLSGPNDLHRPTRVRVLLRGFRRPVRPYFVRRFAFLDRLLFLLGVALPGGRHQGGVDELATRGPVPGRTNLPIVHLEQAFDRPGLRQFLPKRPDRVRVRRRLAQSESWKPKPTGRSPTRRSARASLNPCCAARIRILNMTTGS